MARNAKAPATASGTIKVKQVGSVIGCTDKQRATVRGLGLRRMHQVVERKDTPAIRGMVKAIPHLVVIVSAEILLGRGLIKHVRDGLKVLGDGDLTKALTVRAHKFSARASEKITALGGKAEVIEKA